ncbi:MAG TPA: hypothetical protein VLU99_03760 [Nitrososphaerales archaeon]|nr:hypothetical protein [Nitrososphaerales archaeon]HUK74885.1 hypothetical protein [Nitrososphaerales archaeon]
MADSLEYRLVSATYRDKVYPDGVIFIDSRGEIELRQWTGKKGKKVQVPVARFRPELPVNVMVNGSLLKVSELTISLESASQASEVAEFLKRPPRVQQAEQVLSIAEASVKEFLVSREQAVVFISRLKTDPRGALLGAESIWAADEKKEPIDAVYASYSLRLAEAINKMVASLGGAERQLGPAVFERMCALAYTVGMAQNAALTGAAGNEQLFAALQELGIAANAQDLGSEKMTERFLQRAHPALVALTLEQMLKA